MDRLELIDATLDEIISELKKSCRSQLSLTHFPMDASLLEEATEYWGHGEYDLSFESLMAAMRDMNGCLSTKAAYKLVRLGILMRRTFEREPWLDIDPEFGNTVD